MVIEAPRLMHFKYWMQAIVLAGAAGICGLGLTSSNGYYVLVFGTGLALCLIGIAALTNRYCRRWVFRTELAEEFRFRTLLREHHAAWPEIGRFILDDGPTNRLNPGEVRISLMLTNGAAYEIFTTRALAQEAYEFVRCRPVASTWTGSPAGLGQCLAIGFLGAIVLAVALWCDYEAITDPRVAPAEQGENFGKFLIRSKGGWYVASAAHLLGAGGVGFCAYHLIRRPIFYRPGVFMKSERPETWLSVFFGEN